MPLYRRTLRRKCPFLKLTPRPFENPCRTLLSPKELLSLVYRAVGGRRRYASVAASSVMTVVVWSREAVLTVYRRLLRHGATLQLTDADFYRRRIRDEFKQSKDVTEPAAKLRCIEVRVGLP